MPQLVQNPEFLVLKKDQTPGKPMRKFYKTNQRFKVSLCFLNALQIAPGLALEIHAHPIH